MKLKSNLMLLKRSRVVPVFFAADDKYIKFMAVTLRSIIANSSNKFRYEFYVLHTDITAESMDKIKRLETRNCKIIFVDVSRELAKIEKKIADNKIKKEIADKRKEDHES